MTNNSIEIKNVVGLSLKGLRIGVTACLKAWNREEEEAFRAGLARGIGSRVGGDRRQLDWDCTGGAFPCWAFKVYPVKMKPLAGIKWRS